MKQVIPLFKDQPVNFISINTRDPKGQVDAEIKRHKIGYPVHYGRGSTINADFKVLKLPRLVLVRADGTVYKDVPFMKADELRAEVEKLLKEAAIKADPSLRKP